MYASNGILLRSYFKPQKLSPILSRKNALSLWCLFVCLAVALMSLRSALSILQNIRLLSTYHSTYFSHFFWEPAYKGSFHEKA